MTDEELARQKAEEIEKNQTLGVYDNDEDLARDSAFNDGIVEGYEEGFLAGLKAGRPQWHNLEKKLKTSLDYNKSLLNALKNCGASRLNSGLIERAEYFIKEN